VTDDSALFEQLAINASHAKARQFAGVVHHARGEIFRRLITT
jgi:hypothetical protein